MCPSRRYALHDSDSDSDSNSDHTSDDFDVRMGRTPKDQTYKKALMETQRQHQLLRKKWKDLNAENRQLKAEIASLKEQLDVSSAPKAHKTNTIATELELVKTLAKKYTALYEPFSRIYNDPNLFVSQRPESKCLLPEERFCTNLTARRDGWLAQLYDFLPESLHSMVRGHSNFDIEFRAAAKNMRSALIDRMRKAAPSVFQLPPDIFKPGYQRDTVPELVRLLKFSSDHSKKDRLSKLPPILFPPVVRRKGRVGYETKLFQAPEIFLFLKAVLFGLSSLDTTDQKHGGPSTYGKQWDVISLEKLPFYAIPVFALLTVFVISEDSDFSSKGSQSGRDWEEYFDFLRRQFHAAHGTKEFQRIMSMCQETVFHGQAKGKARADDGSDSGESEINWQLEALNISGEDNDDEDGTPSHEPNEDSFSNLVLHDNFNDGMAVESPVAGPSSIPQPMRSSYHADAVPPRQPTQSSSTLYDADALLPLPPPATPKKSTLGSNVLSDASLNPFDSPPKKAHARKAKRQSKKKMHSISDQHVIPALAIPAPAASPVPPTDDDEEEEKNLSLPVPTLNSLIVATKVKKKSARLEGLPQIIKPGKKKNEKSPPHVERMASNSERVVRSANASVPPGTTAMVLEPIEEGPISEEIVTTTTRTRKATWKKVAFANSDAAPLPKKRSKR